METLALVLSSTRQNFVCESLFDTLTTGVADVINGIKELSACEACLTGLQQATSLSLVGDTMLRLASTVKSPKSAEHLVTWLARAVEQSGFP